MKSSLVTLASVAALALANALPAQIVHLTATGTVTDQFGAAPLWSGGAPGATTTATLHLFYDSRLMPEMEPGVPFGTYLPGDVANNRWELQFGQLEIGAAWQRLTISDTELRAEYFDETSLTTLELNLAFASDPSEGFALPVPPLPALAPAGDPDAGGGPYPSSVGFDTLNGFGLDAGTLLVGIDQLSSEVMPPGGMTAVPEPSTYALGAVALFALAVASRRRREVAGARSPARVEGRS